jgi:hypothetical protein
MDDHPFRLLTLRSHDGILRVREARYCHIQPNVGRERSSKNLASKQVTDSRRTIVSQAREMEWGAIMKTAMDMRRHFFPSFLQLI